MRVEQSGPTELNKASKIILVSFLSSHLIDKERNSGRMIAAATDALETAGELREKREKVLRRVNSLHADGPQSWAVKLKTHAPDEYNDLAKKIHDLNQGITRVRNTNNTEADLARIQELEDSIVVINPDNNQRIGKLTKSKSRLSNQGSIEIELALPIGKCKRLQI